MPALVYDALSALSMALTAPAAHFIVQLLKGAALLKERDTLLKELKKGVGEAPNDAQRHARLLIELNKEPQFQ